MNGLYDIAIFAIPVIIAITLHEAAHGYVARHFGDNTAAQLGRVTLNPLKHIDPLGTIALPALLILTKAGFIFGYARPVPVNFAALRNPKRDMIWVAAAGPGMNIALGTISVLLIYVLSHFGINLNGWPLDLLWNSVEINLVLAVLNLLPIPPLDGSKAVAGILPNTLAVPYWKLQRYGMLIVLILFIALPAIGLNLFAPLVAAPVAAIERPILAFLGIHGT